MPGWGRGCSVTRRHVGRHKLSGLRRSDSRCFSAVSVLRASQSERRFCCFDWIVWLEGQLLPHPAPLRRSCHFLHWAGGKSGTRASLTAVRVSPLWVNLESLPFLIMLYFSVNQREHSEMIAQWGRWLNVMVCMSHVMQNSFYRCLRSIMHTRILSVTIACAA